jgi:putative restriction endonuclease
VREAYDDRCAVSGLKLRNGGRRPEVHAAHIRPIQRNGSDFVGNGLALSGILHWMFDPGLISVADDNETILVSRDKVPGDVVDRLSGPDGKIWKPEGKRNWLHPANLAWHRENIFAQMAAAGSAPWKLRLIWHYEKHNFPRHIESAWP